MWLLQRRMARKQKNTYMYFIIDWQIYQNHTLLYKYRIYRQTSGFKVVRVKFVDNTAPPTPPGFVPAKIIGNPVRKARFPKISAVMWILKRSCFLINGPLNFKPYQIRNGDWVKVCAELYHIPIRVL